MIELKECVKGGVYAVDARNFNVAVYDGKNGFIGIRYKFGLTFLDTELHWDVDEHHGTVKVIEKIGEIPDYQDDYANKTLMEFLKRPEIVGAASLAIEKHDRPWKFKKDNVDAL